MVSILSFCLIVGVSVGQIGFMVVVWFTGVGSLFHNLINIVLALFSIRSSS